MIINPFKITYDCFVWKIDKVTNVLKYFLTTTLTKKKALKSFDETVSSICYLPVINNNYFWTNLLYYS